MKNDQKNPFEEEFRSSQVYKTLSDSGSIVADKIAEGLGKAAQGLDGVLNGFVSGVKNPGGPGPSPTGTPKGPIPGPEVQNARSQPGQNGYYRYQPPRTSGTRPAAPGPQGQPSYSARPQPSPPYQAPHTSQTRPPAGTPQPRSPQGQPPVSPAGRPQNVTPVPPPQMKVVRAPSTAKFYLTGAAALAYAMLFPLYQPAHYAIFALVLALVFLLSSVIFKGKKVYVPIEEKKASKKAKAPKEEAPPKEAPKPEEKPSSTGNPEVDKIIDEGRDYLKKLRAANDAIPDEALSEDIDRMEKASAGIFQYIGEHPEKAAQIHKFMSYYLPTTLKLLNSYQRLSAQTVKGETITSTMFNIAGMMHTVANAFEKQLDSLFDDEAMDISADITVFETLLKQEGFVEEKAEQ